MRAHDLIGAIGVSGLDGGDQLPMLNVAVRQFLAPGMGEIVKDAGAPAIVEGHVMEFSTETSLLAPQFAKSLWGRIMNSPMQLTSYFLGGSQFTKLWHSEKERLGDKFDLKLFMDTIMKAGPIPIDEFYNNFALTTPN